MPKQFIDSNTRKLQTPEIAFIGAANAGEQIDPQMLLAQIMTQLEQGDTLGVQNGNTLFMLVTPPGHEGAGVFQVINADTMQNLAKNGIDFVKLMQQNGYHTLITHFEEPKMAHLVQRIFNVGRAQFDPSTMLNLEKGSKGTYQAIIYTAQSPAANYQEAA